MEQIGVVMDEADIPVGRNFLAIHSHLGDTKVIWDPHNPDEVAAAKQQFDTLKKKGFIAYTVTKKGDKGDIIREFDPDAEKIILSPPVTGG
jgi:hypothetical protein